MIAFPEDFPVSEGGNSQEADAAHPSHASASPAAQQENRAPEPPAPAPTPPAASDCESSQCERCKQCRKFASGDLVELSPEGILAMSRRVFTFGLVRGQAREEKGVRIRVHWDGLPSMLISSMFPRHIQKRFEEGKAFL